MDNSKNIDNKIIEVKLKTIKIDKLANAHPNIKEDDYQKLKENIKMFGQLEPIKIYRRKVIDGRHRVKAMKELGYKTIKAIELNRKLTIKEVREKVLSTKIRRTMTINKISNEEKTVMSIIRKLSAENNFDALNRIREYLIQEQKNLLDS